jgi:N-acetylmuramoyl-L-alanine amidase
LIVMLQDPGDFSGGKPAGGVVSWRTEGRKLVFALDAALVVSRVLTLPPSGSAKHHRLLIDLETVSDARFASRARKDVKRLAKVEAAPAPVTALAGALRPQGAPASPARRPGARFTVVIDPGHGGKDPGAQAITGGVEKDITLASAQYLKALLEENPRYQVFLTRDDDAFVELEDRVSRARKFGADLFISLHADAAGSTSISGASVYTISARGERRVDREADKNSWKIPIEDGTPEQVSGILEDLVKRETKTHSAEFAEALLPELAAAGPVLRGTHRNAGFYVLLAPDVPAVLLELGFLTNAADAKRLKSKAGQITLMSAVRDGIDHYFDQREALFAGQ